MLKKLLTVALIFIVFFLLISPTLSEAKKLEQMQNPIEITKELTEKQQATRMTFKARAHGWQGEDRQPPSNNPCPENDSYISQFFSLLTNLAIQLYIR
jgi:hypothetical protein